MPAAYLLTVDAQMFKAYPPRQAPAHFDAQGMLDSVLSAAASGIGNK